MPSQANCALPPGFQLDQYRIERQLSLGGFSIVYLARDAHGMAVAIKEYLPNSLALRKEGETEPQVSEEHRLAFRYGMKCFFEEGRSLAKLMHPNVVRVLNFFRANGTVYMVMQFERGRTLHDYIRKHRGEVKEMLIRAVFARMLNGLREVHAHKLMHLDIKPSNIYLRNDGTPVLLDFGAARQTLLNDAPMLKPMYTPGYCAPEQFRDRDVECRRDAGIEIHLHEHRHELRRFVHENARFPGSRHDRPGKFAPALGHYPRRSLRGFVRERDRRSEISLHARRPRLPAIAIRAPRVPRATRAMRRRCPDVALPARPG